MIFTSTEGDRSHGDSGGFTLIEVAFVVVLVGVLTGLVVQSLADLARTQAYSRGQVRVSEIGDRVVRMITRDLTVAARVFTDGAQADAVMGVMDVPSTWRPTDSRLPALRERGYFEPDAEGELETGNVLFLVRHQEPAVVYPSVQEYVPVPPAEPDPETEESGKKAKKGKKGKKGKGEEPEVAPPPPPPSSPPEPALGDPARIDLVSFVIYTPRITADGALDLARWGSPDVAVLADIDLIDDVTARGRALRQLYDAGVRHAWDSSDRTGRGLYRILRTESAAILEPFGSETRLPGYSPQVQGSILGLRHIEVVHNGRRGGLIVPAYATAQGSGFPGGFEIKVDGPSTGKLVLVRLVLRTSLGSHQNAAEMVRIVNCRNG